ncbi:substrate-binding domain-containing protein [Streptomyces sp. ME19-01-6]|uniref:substrate-binding domain-containing protein n=1 Tax=Streptomyces sp. ME19-01-6 TaxID=3028686 RepID=UPI0029AEE3ED|nr:substrate-binding domain-containing protein [Streptomyces sp. ME19-01-6]MDX3233053.1 substrate-binding domain-containing protein [Streptomyces sp. ME19-01-6]
MKHFAHALDRAGSRLVLVGRPPIGDGVPATVVDYDNEGGTFALTTRLLSSGRRRVSYLGRVQGLSTSAQRISGFVRANEARGLCHDPALTADGLFSRSVGYQAVRRPLASRADFDAMFAATDIVAPGAMQALREEGIQVPDNVAIAGYDDITMALDVYPALTTVHVPHEELGRAAVRLALHREEFPESRHQVFGTCVVVRDSIRTSGR